MTVIYMESTFNLLVQKDLEKAEKLVKQALAKQTKEGTKYLKII